MIVRCESPHPTVEGVVCQRVEGHEFNWFSRKHSAAMADWSASVVWDSDVPVDIPEVPEVPKVRGKSVLKGRL